jgi:hypothetical protein
MPNSIILFIGCCIVIVSVIGIVCVTGDRAGEVFLGGHEEGSDGSGLVPLSTSEACSVGDLPRLVTMIFKGIAEEDGEFVISLMLVLVVLLCFDQRGMLRGARGVGAEGELVRVTAKLADASILDESERQVFVVVEVIQDLVVLITERVISRSLEGSHED